MDIRRLTSEAGLPVSLDALKQDLRIDDDDFDDTLKRMSATAAGLIERRSGYILNAGTFEATTDSFGYAQGWSTPGIGNFPSAATGGFPINPGATNPWTIMRAPLRKLTSIKAMTDKNVWTDVDTDDFQVIEAQRSFQIIPFPDFQEPQLFVQQAGIKIQFSAGFDVILESGEEVASGDGDFPLDETVKGVFIALVGHYYENRELFAADNLTKIESTAGGLLNSIRMFW